MMKNNQTGFSFITILCLIALIGAIGMVGWNIVSTQGNATEPGRQPQSNNSKTKTEPQELLWRQTEVGWSPTSTVPDCPAQPMLTSPIDVGQVTSVLYPGQIRGGNYKPHGGFRLDNTTDNAVSIKAPLDGFIVRGSSYIEGEVQYMFDVMNNCGIMFRIDHIRELPPKLQKIADSWPEPTTNSATHNVHPAVFIKQGEILSTKVGLLNPKNVGFDLGVYDFRRENDASKSSTYRNAHSNDKELSWHAVCWLKDWLPKEDVATLAKLPPGDPNSGKNSDYCQ